MNRPDFTLSAGPVESWPEVHAALTLPTMYHYDPSFIALFKETQQKVQRLFGTTNDVVLMQGEAILGLESSARSLVYPGMPVLNLVQGVFGKGMGYWLRNFGAEVHEIEVPYDRAVSPDVVDDYLSKNPDTELLVYCASETPSGSISDLEGLSRVAKRHGVVTLVDAVSALGSVSLDVDSLGIDVCVSGAQKCLGGTPGISLISVSDAAWSVIRNNPEAPKDSYRSLLDWKDKWLDQEVFPYTPLVNEIYALDAACQVALAEGMESVIERHRKASRVARAGVEAMGLDLWIEDSSALGSCVTSIALPERISHDEIRTSVRRDYGVMISSGQGAGNFVRVSHMGPTATLLHPILAVSALGRSLVDHGMELEIGRGVDAALEYASSIRE